MQRQTLEAIAAGHAVLGHAFVAASQTSEDRIFLGHASFAVIVERMSDARVPLVLDESGAVIVAPTSGDARAFWRRRAALTDNGRDVLASLRDNVALNGIDRWLGGVNLTDRSLWRWDAAAGSLRAERPEEIRSSKQKSEL